MVRASITASCALLLAVSLAAQQQDNNAAPPQQQNQSNAGDQRKPDQQKADQQKADQQKAGQQKKGSAAQENPFPEGQSEQAAQQDQQKDSSAPAQDAPAANGQQKKPSAAEENPFPESESEKAAHQTAQPSPSSAPSGSAQPDQDYSSSQEKLKGLDLPGAHDARIADGAGGTILSPEVGRKDTKVGEFYLHTGDYKGAYDRFVEATKVDPGNAQAVFDLAEAARHLNNRAEAVRNYQLYLSAVPDGPRSKDARKALKDLGVRPNS